MSDTSSLFDNQSNDPSFFALWDELLWRGLVHVSTDADVLKEALTKPLTFYCGFDPTAASLHLGHLVQLLLMRRLQLAGHHPIGLVGGATGLVGDPRPTAERTLNTRETVAAWVDALRAQVSRYVSFSGTNPARIVNNLDWTEGVDVIAFLRDIGVHYRVGTMLKKDAVSARLNSEIGINFTEFSYQILQGFDFLELYRRYGCVLQTGGSDQWGNLTSGTDLIHRVERTSVYAIGTPLITNSDGTKFGKSEGNAIWLNPEMTSPYAFYQFWLNTDDSDVVDRLKVFTFRTRTEIAALSAAVDEQPHKREAQKTLASDVTSLVHGVDATRSAVTAAAALFGTGDLAEVPAGTLVAALREAPHTTAPPTITLAQALVDAGLTTSLGEARRAVAQGGVYVNNTKMDDHAAELSAHVLPAGVVVIRRGKKAVAGVFVE